jgi:surface polysaccharide O-acyltransferase-like enzyme
MEKSKRIFYLDAMRLMAIIGIIFCHASVTYIVTDMGTPNFYVTAFFDCFRDICVPIFVMLSGALLIGKKDSFITFFKKRLSRILIPFLFWAAMTILYYFVKLKNPFNIDDAISIFLGQGGTLGVAFWFVWMILIVYIGIFIINKTLEYGNRKIYSFDEKFIPLLALLSVSYIAMFQFNILSPIFYDSVLIYYFSFVSYAIIGYFLVHTNWLESHVKTSYLAIIFLILSALLYVNYICSYVVPASLLNHHLTYLGYFNIRILLISVCVFLMVKFMSNTYPFKKIENSKFGDGIVVLSRYSYGIYLCHYLVLFHMKKFKLLYYVDFPHQNSLIWIPLLVIIVLTISFIKLWILNKVPYLNKVTGVN